MTILNCSSVPLIIKPWHQATLRWVPQETRLGGKKLVGFFRLSFEGPGFSKEWPFRFENPEHAIPTIKKLGFRKYRVRYHGSRYFSEHDFSDPWDEDGVINWEYYYRSKGLWNSALPVR